MSNPIQPAPLTEGERNIGVRSSAGTHVFTVDQVENLIGARVAAALRDAADYFDKYDEVVVGESDIGSNLIPIDPSERLRMMADEVDAS